MAHLVKNARSATRTHLLLEPLPFLARLAALIPAPATARALRGRAFQRLELASACRAAQARRALVLPHEG